MCVAWWCWYAGSQPVGMDERRLAGGGLAMVTQVGLILMAAAAALLVVGDRRPGFFGALTVSPGLHRLLASKLGSASSLRRWRARRSASSVGPAT